MVNPRGYQHTSIWMRDSWKLRVVFEVFEVYDNKAGRKPQLGSSGDIYANAVPSSSAGRRRTLQDISLGDPSISS